MRIEIIATGSELVSGVTVDTNSAMIAQKLRGAGLDVQRITLVGDGESEIADALSGANSRAELLIVTGGLGPTEDDRTRFAAAKVFGGKMVTNAATMEKIENLFKALGRPMRENNKIVAQFPEGAAIFENYRGTADGFSLENENGCAVFLPGVPAELEKMLEMDIVQWAAEKAGVATAIETAELHSFGIPESEMDDMLRPFYAAHPDVELAFSVQFPVVRLRLASKGLTAAEASSRLTSAVQFVRDTLGDHIFTEEKLPMSHVTGKLLADTGQTIALAESCTGGMLASLMTDVAGSSDYFIESAVTYSNDAKMRRLGVTPETLETFGAVSEQCAREMAEGVRQKSGATIGLSITGIAGPGGGTPDKPVGTVHMALAHKDGTLHWQNRYPGGRDWVRKLTSYAALDRIRRYCLGL